MNVTVRLHFCDPGEDFSVGCVPDSERAAWGITTKHISDSRVRVPSGLAEIHLAGMRVVGDTERFEWSDIEIPEDRGLVRPWVSVCRTADEEPLFAIEVQDCQICKGDTLTLTEIAVKV